MVDVCETSTRKLIPEGLAGRAKALNTDPHSLAEIARECVGVSTPVGDTLGRGHTWNGSMT